MIMEIETILIDKENLTPEEFLDMSDKEKLALKKITIVPPKLGRSGFGGFEVEYNHPIFNPVFGLK